MNIFEYMSFNPEWFLTVPGILITVGIVLLLVALIVLITSGKKDNDEGTQNTYQNDNNINNDYNSYNQNVNPQMPMNQNIQNDGMLNSYSAPIEVPSFDNMNQPQMPTDNQGVNPMEQPQTLNINPVQQPTEPIQSQPVINFSSEVSENSVVESPVKEPSLASVEQPISDVGTYNIPSMDMSTQNNLSGGVNISAVEMPQEPLTPPVEVAPQVEMPVKQEVYEQPAPSVSIYGGASPVSNFNIDNQPTKPVIYGGADPLENTAPIPKVENILVTPQVEARVVEPIEQPNVAQPTFVNNNVNPVVDNSFNMGYQDTHSQIHTPENSANLNQTPVNNIQPEVETLEF